MPEEKIKLRSQINNILQHNRDGSHSTQAARKAVLNQSVTDLKSLGFYNLSTKGLKPKHIDELANKWVNQGLSAGTLKNRMSHLRWLSEKVGKPGIVARDNTHYGIERRQYVTNQSKARNISNDQISKVQDPHLKASLQMQREFGLRREECIKFKPDYALNHDRDGYIRLKATWCKGGRERYVPIRTEAQRQALVQAQKIAGKGSLIPENLRYVDQMNKYMGECKKQGLSKMHGLRHQYAQQRYEEIAGFKSPADGGPQSRELSEQQKALDYSARMQITEELGHGREQITAVYLGR